MTFVWLPQIYTCFNNICILLKNSIFHDQNFQLLENNFVKKWKKLYFFLWKFTLMLVLQPTKKDKIDNNLIFSIIAALSIFVLVHLNYNIGKFFLWTEQCLWSINNIVFDWIYFIVFFTLIILYRAELWIWVQICFAINSAVEF